MRRFPSFSVIVEWENARRSGARRASRMLRELASQTAELSTQLARRPELIVLYEKQAIAPDVVEHAVRAACGAEPPFEVFLHSTEGVDYYAQKNLGAELSNRRYLLFLDSDVVPEPGWLRALLGSLRPGVDIVGGTTYVEPDTFFGRAFGLFWFFPPRSQSNGLRESKFFYANNVIFRRELFLAYKFADLPLYRGHCEILAAMLHRDGIKLFKQAGARVSHPPPSARHFVHRALCEGYDVIMRARLTGRTRPTGRGELRRQLANLQDRVAKRLPQLKVGRGEVTAALALARTYSLLRFTGERLALRSPERAQKLLGIPSMPLPPPVVARPALNEAQLP